ncbi:MAG: hypothetical protein KatS3mg105_3978 [Gemmatales bacterium]|nr:MAG: hypothetical protein KatS3mg105_3978 [Gemmatales bacterium]
MQVVSVPQLQELRDFVLKRLCSLDNLDPEQTPMFEGKIYRRGDWCGLFFHVQGPRLLKSYALWSAADHRIYFYDSTGARVDVVHLSESPALERPAA